MARSLLYTIALLFLTATSALAQGAALDPQKTFVFAASIVKWPEAAGLDPFDDVRRDGDLVAAFNVAGVASDRITMLLDEKATRDAMRRELRALASRAGEGSTLVFYFQGHGDKQDGKAYLMCYDVTEDVPNTAFAVSEIAPILDECFKGDRVILLGDCCHSGALGQVVAHFEKSRVKAACFTSATASNRSTEHWTFTEGLIDALDGDGRLDRDHDGTVSFEETDHWIHEIMKYREGQLTHAVRTRSFEPTFTLHKVDKTVPATDECVSVGDFVDAQDAKGSWRLAEVTGFEQKRFRVKFLDVDPPRVDETLVAPAGVRPPTATQLEVGARYEVEWEEGEWFPGTVTKAEEGWFFFVHYEGEAGDDDEWVVASRARKPSPPEFVALAPRAAKKGDAVAARWRKEWFLGTVLSVDARSVKVRYSDGTEGRVTKDEFIVLASADELADGERVIASWNDEARLYPGTVVKKNGKTVTIRWEDGSDPTEVPVGKIARVKAAK